MREGIGVSGHELERLITDLQARGIRMLRYLYVDNDGVIRGFVGRVENAVQDFQDGVTVALAMPFFTAFDHLVPGTRYGCTGEWRLKPAPETLRALPYAPGHAAVLCDFATLDLRPAPEVCARTQLRRVLDRLTRETGLTLKVGLENEFYLVTREDGRWVPADQALCFHTSAMNRHHRFVEQVVRQLAEQGIEVESYYPEYGHGQQEFAYRYADALLACDEQIFARETIRAVAEQHQLVATFMPKPFADQAGSGMHMHLSLWDGERNVFYDEQDPHGLSDVAYHFIAGLIAHAPAVCAFTAASINSYRRLAPNAWAAVFACYGIDNREAVIRVPSPLHGRKGKTTRVEFKAVDAAGNPYLAVAAVVAAGLDGIRRGLRPGDPVAENPADLRPAEREERGIRRLPGSLPEALAALEQDTWFHEVFGEAFIQEYVQMKRHDWAEFMAHVTDWELERYLKAF
ncbi:Glutamate--ammonia ligase [Thermaerobacter marianensis DSM 12885]|uniref:Glutamate--ammonia ligase n=1 Tax=Thermaerobacter marianensis (strain ATCC 700841 / DSM 12885 / JCM 10246 / 7p75a) TaxID=644966 RepID=E6SIQ1_THEM7|nr:glutamine synthetase family protein [Thermaerobacter marianensis]ADU51995.1 Glutamate--ammonia ligase [Thermaerobacter marianensis DSM 12885]